MGAVAVQIPERGALRGGFRLDARRAVGEVRGQPSHQAAPHQRPQRDPVIRNLLGMWRVGIAIRGQLQRAETQNARRAAFMTRPAVRSRRDVVAQAAAHDDATREAAVGCEHRANDGAGRHQGGVFPALRGVLDKARLGAAREPELFPEARADRKLPDIRVRRVDERARRQLHPARLDRAVGP